MALVDSCLCCSLMVASFVMGVYALVAYVIAFTVELWWIVESDGGLPAPAHLLCAGYFVSLVLCAVLLHGLTVRRSLCLVVWLVGVAALALPEAGMVLYMALQHWRLQSLYGLTEITCWACRLFINAVGVVSVQSLYSSWREESEVMRRLRDLNMSSTMSTMSTSNGRRGSVASVNGVGPMVHLGPHPHPHPGLGLAYQNEGFVGSMSQLNGKPPGGTYAVPLQPMHGAKLKRSASSVSRRSTSSCVSLPAMGALDGSVYGYPVAPMARPGPGLSRMGTLPLGAHMGALPPPGPLHRTDSASEFNAAAFDGMLAASFRQPAAEDVVDGGGGGGGVAPGRRGAGRGPGRAQSLVDLSRSASRLGDYWRVETVTAPSRPAPAPAAYMLPTRSLDRRLRPRRAVSMADLGASVHAAPFVHAGHFGPAHQPVYYRDAYGRDFVYPAPSPYVHPGMLYKGASSKTSLGAASDDFRKYRDVAL